jgi:DNA polymerase-3 subunit delta'
MITAHAAARRLISRAVARGKLAHAYLLGGPEGSGKRTLALEFGGSLLCEKRAFPPCRECGPCRRALGGTHPDLMMVEAEGRDIRIDQVRELTAKLQYHAFEGGYKVAIILNAEKMNEPAMNAFLKTLEEPPADTVLILTCANLSRLLPTILSRTQVLRLGPLPTAALTELVKRERGLGEEEARLVASLSQGNGRRALELDLELVIGFRKEMIKKLIELDREDRIAVLDYAQRLADASYPPENLLDLLAAFYQDLVRLKLGKTELQNQDLGPEAQREIKRTSLPRLLRQLELIHEIRTRLTQSANPRLCFEVLTAGLKA